MISKDFLKHRLVAGLEFMDFQNNDFYQQLSTHLASYINDKGVIDQAAEDGILLAIREFTGFKNVTMKWDPEGNAGIDAGYFSPNHVLNAEMVDELLPTTETSLYKWFKYSSTKLFKGTVDYTTGKVGGSFAEIPLTLYLNPNTFDYLNPKLIEKYRVEVPGLMTGVIAHEMGHAFGACMMMMTLASDNLLAKAGLRCYQAAKTTEERVVVLKDVTSLLDIPAVKREELHALSEKEGDAPFMLYFNKMVSQRNTRRSLSVGVENMSSEVVADMYAIRMGCDKGIIAAIGHLVDKGIIRSVLTNLMMSVFLSFMLHVSITTYFVFMAAGGLMAHLVTMGLIFVFIFVTNYFSPGYAGVYNADHRRFEDAARQMIGKVKECKDMPTKTRSELIEDTERLVALSKTLKPWYGDTVLYRFMGWMFNGGDFKKIEIEHFSNALNNHELNLLPAQFASVTQPV